MFARKLIGLATLALVACSQGENRVVVGATKQQGGAQGDPAGDQSPSSDLDAQPSDSAPAAPAGTLPFDLPSGPLYRGTYNLVVRTDFLGGMDVCEGRFTAVVNQDMTFTLESPSLSCLGGLCEVDVAALTAGFSSMAPTQTAADPGKIAEMAKSLAADGNYLTIGQLGGASFTPPRPLFLSPLTKNPAGLAAINVQYQGSLRNAATGESATGRIALAVDAANDAQIQWHIASDGWDGVSRIKYALLKRVDFTWNRNPIGVARVAVTMPIGDLMKASPAPGTAAAAKPNLAKVCTGTTGELLGGLFGGGDDAAAQEPADTSGGMADLFSDVEVSAELTLVQQTILGKPAGGSGAP